MEKENSIKIILEQVNKEIENIQNTLGVIDLKGKSWKTDLTDVFVIVEFSRFLDMEYETSKCKGIMTRIPLKDYDLLVKEDVDVIEQILDFYYNDEIGTSYDDYEIMLKDIIRQRKEMLEWEKIQNQ